MNCPICDKYKANTAITPIDELDGITLNHIAPSQDGLAMKGRLIVEPKRHVTRPEELTPKEFANMGVLLQKAILLLERKLGAEHVYFFRINDLVAHFHFHVMPRFANTPKDFWGLKIIDWPDIPKINPAEIEAISAKLRNAMT